jgi:SNF2 family DNA or RNA helicase
VRVRARLGRDGHAIELLPTDDNMVGLSRALRAAEPPIRGRRYDGRLVVGFEDASRLEEVIAQVDYDSAVRRAVENRRRVDAVAESVLTTSRDVIAAGAAEARRRIADSDLAVQLDDHQAVNVAVMTVPHGWGTCVFDEQGTGKTVTVVTAFDVLAERGEADALIVVAPKSMIAEWEQEFLRFTGRRYRVAVADGSRHERERAIDSGANVVVVNYETALSHGDSLRLLAQRARAVLAVDESFFVKNPQASRSRAVRSLREWCGRCFVLCGTPAPNTPHDLVAQFDLVDFGRTFREARLDPDRDVARDQVRAVLDRRGFFVRNLKNQVLPDLPQRSFGEVKVPLAPQQQAAYDAAARDLVLDLRATSDREFSRNLTTYLERRAALLRICSDPGALIPGYDELPAKIAALDALLAELVGQQREKVVVWSFYRAALQRIASRYADYGVARIDGSVSDVAERRDAVRRFQEDDSTMIFVGNPAAAGAGLTLHRSNVAVYESLSNQAAHFLQSLDRIHRRGQTRPVSYVTLLADGSLEEAEYRRLLEKADRQADLLGDRSEPRMSRSMMLEELLVGREQPSAAT